MDVAIPAWVAAGAMLAANIIGLVVSSRRNGKRHGEEAGAMRSIVDNLPCVKDSDYQINMGILTEKVTNLELSMDRRFNEARESIAAIFKRLS